jgi:gluconolactonase
VSIATRTEPVRIAETDAHEGPVYDAGEHALYFTTQRPLVDVKRLDLETGAIALVRADANVANGMAPYGNGRLLVCEQDPAAVTLLDPATGAVDVLVESWRGRPLNSPNDVVRKSDGTVWFTDPSYGHLQGFRPEPQVGECVYRYDADGARLTLVADAFDKPNGIAFSPDESTLYVSDNGGPQRILAFEVRDGRRLGPARGFAAGTPGHPDGLKVDAQGNVYASTVDGIQIFDPSGAPIDEIDLPGAVNFTFGGPRRDILYVTSDDAVWAVQLDARGALR